MDPDIKLSQVLGITFVYHFVNNVTLYFRGYPGSNLSSFQEEIVTGQATAISVIEGAFTWGLYAVLGAILLLVKVNQDLFSRIW